MVIKIILLFFDMDFLYSAFWSALPNMYLIPSIIIIATATIVPITRITPNIVAPVSFKSPAPFASIDLSNSSIKVPNTIFDIKNRTKDLDPICLTDSYGGYKKYETACEEAIKYCLENLI